MSFHMHLRRIRRVFDFGALTVFAAGGLTYLTTVAVLIAAV